MPAVCNTLGLSQSEFYREHSRGLDAIVGEMASEREQSASLATGGDTTKPPVRNIPLPPTSLVGREQEAEAVRSQLMRDDVRLLTLVGTGGIGKTRLAIHVAAALADQFRHGVHFVDLAPANDAGLFVSAVAQSLRVSEANGKSLLDSLRGFLQDKQLLLLLDNFEHILAAAPLVAELMASAAGLKVLATSRVRLHLRGEHLFPVPPLALPDPTQPPVVESLMQYAAIALFVERATKVQPRFALTAENAAAVCTICTQLDGLPLAIELAAAHSRLLPPQAMVSKLEPRLPLLAGGQADLPARQKTLRNTLDWSHNLLQPDEQRLFHHLAVFAGGFTLGAAEAVCTALGMARLGVLNGLDSLVNGSLLQQEDYSQPEPRFHMLQTVREYAQEWLKKSGEAGYTRRQCLVYFLALAEEAEPELRGPQQEAWLDRLEREHDNFRAALAHGVAEEDATEDALRLAAALMRFWLQLGYLSEGREWLAGLQRSSVKVDRTVKAKALYAAGALAYNQGDYGVAVPLLEDCLELCRELGNHVGGADAQSLLGNVARQRGDFHRAAVLQQASLAAYRSTGDLTKTAAALNNLGLVMERLDEMERARQYYEESLAIKRQRGDELGAASSLHNLGELAARQGEFAAAEAYQRECLDITRRLGSKQGAALTLNELGNIALAREDTGSARNWYQEALTLLRDVKDRMRIAECLEGLAAVAEAEGDVERALTLAAAADALRDAVKAPLAAAKQERHDRLLTLARNRLGQASFRQAETRGRGMDMDAALAFGFSPNASGKR
ncbi:MAG: tetratricopeptide repeat protein [Chloroflexi bacterium]|nr:tetratricopeptide repeat protein [Chloroflexota bacterium]